MYETTRRLYHYTPAQWALKAIRDHRLKATEPDNSNDLFEIFPYQWDTYEERETAEYFRRRMSQGDSLSGRILCFSKTCTSPLLWGHYAEKGRGICLGFDVSEAYPVKYKCDRVRSGSKICHEDTDPLSEMPRLLVKSWHWRHEEEWRIWGNIDNLELCPITGSHYFPFGGRLKLAEILIGPRCEEENIRRRLETLTVDYDPKPDIVLMDLSRSKFSIERRM